MSGAGVRCVLLLVALAVAGCSSPAAEPAAPSSSSVVASLPAVPGISAEVVRLRTDEAVGGQFQLRVTNTGDGPFTVTSVALRSPGFDADPSRAVDVDIDAGRTIDLPVRYGSARCADTAGPAGAALDLRRADGSTAQVLVPLTGGTLQQVFDEECARQQLAAAVTVTLTPLTDTGDAVTGTVLLTRRAGDEPVQVTALGGSVLYHADPTGELPASLAAGRPALELPVAFTAARCDPHALADAKKPFVFPLTVVVGDRPPVAVDLPVDDAARAVLQAYDLRACAAG
ncbi:hypothetical protein GB931_12180 [Modestobacter sp. I12A-02628]|uniref:Lipoprotein n=1 Tax=Goekera deserti TaxID=2497753 RepID=A0A7K3W9D7_9ACTN|nr:hypothetical protein [Goekera deserti]MPQ98664.1 hypothetical protein [Goekera deserti]NDI49226.1 hypothetical protein [Goekera deserti]NEL52964.1 hypothetical protein [Goekera deserti]